MLKSRTQRGARDRRPILCVPNSPTCDEEKTVNAPHYLLFAEAAPRTAGDGQWRFVLQAIDGSEKLEATDQEPEVAGERLELLTVVRGLEALDQPACVTLVTRSRYVNRGLLHGMKEWRRNGWNWERFGQMVPVKNRDLWIRVDRALRYHQVDCRRWRVDGPHRVGHAAVSSVPASAERDVDLTGRNSSVWQRRVRRTLLAIERRFHDWSEGWRLRLAQLGTGLLALPWLD